MAAPYSEFPANQAGQSLRVLLWDQDLVDMWVLDAAGERVPFRGKGSVWHAHADCELTCITAGDGILQVGDHSGRFSAPDCLLLGAEVPHVWKARGDSAGVSLQFRTDAPLLSAPELVPLTRLWAHARHGLRLTGATADHLRAELPQFAGQSSTVRLGRFIALLDTLRRAPATDLVVLSARAHTALSVGEQDRAMGRVLDHLIAHFADEIRVDDLVRLSGCSPATFARRFTRLTGTTVVDYLHTLRIQEVQRVLLESDRPVTDVAFAAGFNNLAHFNAIFKRHSGCSPSQYRKQQRTVGVGGASNGAT
jgi:AraC-like DNA-binding protein